MEKTLEDLQLSSIRRLANLLSYDLEIKTSEEGFQIIKNPLVWIQEKLRTNGSFSNLILAPFGDEDDRELNRSFEKNTERAEIFEIGRFGSYDKETIMPSSGRFLAVLDLGNSDCVMIHGMIFDGKTISVNSVQCLDSNEYEEALRFASKFRFKEMFKETLGLAIAGGVNGDVPLSNEDILEVMEGVIAENSALHAALAARNLEILIGHGEQAEAAQTKPRLHRGGCAR